MLLIHFHQPLELILLKLHLLQLLRYEVLSDLIQNFRLFLERALQWVLLVLLQLHLQILLVFRFHQQLLQEFYHFQQEFLLYFLLSYFQAQLKIFLYLLQVALFFHRKVPLVKHLNLQLNQL